MVGRCSLRKQTYLRNRSWAWFTWFTFWTYWWDSAKFRFIIWDSRDTWGLRGGLYATRAYWARLRVAWWSWDCFPFRRRLSAFSYSEIEADSTSLNSAQLTFLSSTCFVRSSRWASRWMHAVSRAAHRSPPWFPCNSVDCNPCLGAIPSAHLELDTHTHTCFPFIEKVSWIQLIRASNQKRN